MHVIIDGFGGDPDQLDDENVVRAVLERYPTELGMTKIAPPTVVRYRGSKPEDWGVSGYVMIAESHISMHTFPERRLIWADVFSCKEFDAAPIVEDLKRQFRLREMDVNMIPRGLEAPAPTASA
ncbi:MAG TPA: S-adenosylmethionine decarboxylase [Dehalococcoidia bacterium]|nr:S-adenosylmethionine decarboxylase [Dehalococcoidia bacterium]